MIRRRLHHLATTFLVVVSVLFAQLALAQYICPAGSAGEVAVAMEMADGQPCAGMAGDGEQPVLCHQHCADAAQSFEPLKLPSVSLPAVVQVLVVARWPGDTPQRPGAAPEAQPPPAPVFLSTLRLRV